MCQFENDEPCIFSPIISLLDNVKWDVFQASAFDLRDHTTNSRDGHFFGLNLSQIGKSFSFSVPTHNVESTELNIATAHCLQFSYFLEGVPDTTSLFFEVHNEDEVDISYRGWTVAGNTLGRFFTHRAHLRLPSETAKRYRLRFGPDLSGKRGQGGLFIDDVKLTAGQCLNVLQCDFEVCA